MKPIISESDLQLEVTADGSHTLRHSGLDETYHSRHGAVQESMHVFINSGLRFAKSQCELAILEIGFGTGLNAYLTARELAGDDILVHYTALELHPLPEAIWRKLNYPEVATSSRLPDDFFAQLHRAPWEVNTQLLPTFCLHKVETDFLTWQPSSPFGLIYFDAFGFRAQAEMWQQPLFDKLYEVCMPGGVLVTYAAKGVIRRAMQASGFTVERLPGPPGKREMLRAVKPHI